MKNTIITIAQQTEVSNFSRQFLMGIRTTDTFGQVLGNVAFRLHQQMCLAKGSKQGKGIDLRKPFTISLQLGDTIISSSESVWYADETTSGLTAKGQHRFGHKLAKAMYDVLLDKGMVGNPDADLMDAEWTLEHQAKAIRTLLDESFVDLIESI